MITRKIYDKAKKWSDKHEERLIDMATNLRTEEIAKLIKEQFLSKELVLRKIDERKDYYIYLVDKKGIQDPSKQDEVLASWNAWIDALNWVKQILNECSAKENSLLKKLEMI